LSTEPVLISPCLAFAAYASQMAVLHLSFRVTTTNHWQSSLNNNIHLDPYSDRSARDPASLGRSIAHDLLVSCFLLSAVSALPADGQRTRGGVYACNVAPAETGCLTDSSARAYVRRRISIHGNKNVPEYYTSIIRPFASLMPIGSS
jgi:hypothetical protein